MKYALLGTGPSSNDVDMERLCQNRWVLGVNGACLVAPVQGVVWHDLNCPILYHQGIADHTEVLIMSQQLIDLLQGRQKHDYVKSFRPTQYTCDKVMSHEDIQPLRRIHKETDTTATQALSWISRQRNFLNDEVELYGIDLEKGGPYNNHRPAMEFMSKRMTLINCCPSSTFDTGHSAVRPWSGAS